MKIQDGVSLHVIQTTKFKDIQISIRFQNTLDRKTACARSLLALLLCDRCKRYDTKKKMSDRQDQLYGATLMAQTAGYGKSQIIEIRSKIIHPRYIPDGSFIMNEWIAFLKEVLFSPLLSEDVFQEGKSILLSKMERMKDDPSQYVISRGLQLAGVNTSLGIAALGEIEDLENCTLQDLQKTYEAMIKDDDIAIILCGDIEEQLVTVITETIQFQPRHQLYASYYLAENQLHEEYQEEYKNITQSYIMMLWFTNTQIIDKDYYALRVANAMFGQYSTSLLFQEVREKNSLCYSIFSNLISYDGALGVTTGVEKANIEKTIKLIKEQLQRLLDEDFDERLVDISKTMIINSLKASKDAMNTMIALAYQNKLLMQENTNEDMISAIQNVTKADAVQVLKKLELKQTLVITKEDSHEENR